MTIHGKNTNITHVMFSLQDRNIESIISESLVQQQKLLLVRSKTQVKKADNSALHL